MPGFLQSLAKVDCDQIGYLCKMFLIFCCVFIAWSAQNINADCPPIIGRKEWDAAKSIHSVFYEHPLDLIIIQHTVTQTCSNDQSCAAIVRDLQKTHLEKSFLWDIGPSFLVAGTGKLYEGRGWNHVAMHTPGYNNQSIAIAFIGNFNNQEPSKKALESAKALIQCGVNESFLTKDHKVVVHSQLLLTESPGKKLASKIMTWSDWVEDVTQIKKGADKLDSRSGEVEPSLKTDTGLALTSPKDIDLLSNLRDVIATLINNLSKLAHGTVDTITDLSTGMNKQVSLFIEKVVSELKNLKDKIEDSLSAISLLPGTEKCSKSIRAEADALYDDTEAKTKECANQRVKEIDDMIKNLGTLSANAIEYSNTAVENTKNCTELNYGITENTKSCLNSVTQQTESASNTYESQRATSLQSIQTSLKALPAALDLCAKQHLLTASRETTKLTTSCAPKSAFSLFP